MIALKNAPQIAQISRANAATFYRKHHALEAFLCLKIHAAINAFVAGLLRREAANALNKPMLKLEWIALKQLFGLLNAYGNTVDIEMLTFDKPILIASQNLTHHLDCENGDIASNPLAVVFHGGIDRSAASAEWIEYNVAPVS